MQDTLARIEREKRLLPKRGENPYRHHAMAITGYAGEEVAKPRKHDYSKQDFRLVDFRESVLPALPPKPQERRRICLAWLFAQGEEGSVILVHDFYAEQADGSRDYLGTTEFAADRVTALVRAERSLLEFQDFVQASGLNLGEVLLTDKEGNSLVVVTSPTATLDTVANTRNLLDKSGFCEFVEVDSVVHPCLANNDPMSSNQWWLEKIGAPEAWEITTGSHDILVGVVDTGVLYTHNDLIDNLWQGPDGEYGICTYDGSYDKRDASLLDHDGHGTHVSGIIGAVGNNGIGISGVNWSVKLVTVNYTDEGGTTLHSFASDSIAGFEYCKEQGCRVINYSSGTLEGDEFTTETAISTFGKGVDSLHDAGVILVCAAGNEENNNDKKPSYPSNCEGYNVVAVAASTRQDDLAYFSNYGLKSVDIAAPGEEIFSTYKFYFVDAIHGHAFYGTKQGTSMASPVVAGALALMMTRYPDDDYQRLLKRLYASSDKIEAMSNKLPEGRRVNLANAIDMLEQPVVKASQGLSRYHIDITWQTDPRANYTRLFYSTDEDKTLIPLTDWQRESSFRHETVLPGIQYYYHVDSAVSANGSNASLLSEPAPGYLQQENPWLVQGGHLLICEGETIRPASPKPILSKDGECLWTGLDAEGNTTAWLSWNGESRNLCTLTKMPGQATDANEIRRWKMAANRDFTLFAFLFAFSREDTSGEEVRIQSGLCLAVLDRLGKILWQAPLYQEEDALVLEKSQLVFVKGDSILLYDGVSTLRQYTSEGKVSKELSLPGLLLGRMAYAENADRLFVVQALSDDQAGIATLDLEEAQLQDTMLRIEGSVADPQLCVSEEGNTLFYRKSEQSLGLAVPAEENGTWEERVIPAPTPSGLSLSAAGDFALWQSQDETGLCHLSLYDVLSGFTAEVDSQSCDFQASLAADGYSTAAHRMSPSGILQLWLTTDLGNACHIKLLPGWNPIALPFAPAPEVQETLQDFDTLFTWQQGYFTPWNGVAYPGMTCWLFTEQEKTLLLKGRLADIPIPLRPGWNLQPAWLHRTRLADGKAFLLNPEAQGYQCAADGRVAVGDCIWLFMNHD